LKTVNTYHLLAFLFLAVSLSACNKQLNKRVTLWRNDKIPYGTYYAYNNLQYIFSNAEIKTSDKSPETFYRYTDGADAYIVIGAIVRPSERELNALLNHAIAGNHVFISAYDFGENLLDSFKLGLSAREMYRNDSLAVALKDSTSETDPLFVYPGFAIARHFSKMDSSVTSILGTDDEGHANFVKFNYQNGGAVYLQAAPAAFTNFFLLHKNNKHYYDRALSSIPDTVSYVKWDDYFRHHIDGVDNANISAFSKLKAFLSNEVLRWAFWLTILLFAIVYLIESKRKQRIIPVQKKLKNTSLDFVKTVGRLYYQRRDNKNLAQKMSTHFLSHIRSRYNMNTSQLDEDFESRLAYKSGKPITLVKEIISGIQQADINYEVSDDELMTFNEKIDSFINKP
jgi:hypothetical protein